MNRRNDKTDLVGDIANPEQVRIILQWLLGATGPLTAVFVAYEIPPDKITVWTNLIIAIGPGLVSLVWGYIRQRNKNRIKSVSEIPDVSSVSTYDHPKDTAIAALAASEQAPKVLSESDVKVSVLKETLPPTPMRAAAVAAVKTNGNGGVT